MFPGFHHALAFLITSRAYEMHEVSPVPVTARRHFGDGLKTKDVHNIKGISIFA
jgi:hypothetical protein